MQTSGSSQLHWDNITNAPSFGFSWDNPVLARSVQISSTPPVAPADGDFYIDTDDDQLYKYDGTTWVSAGAPTTGDRVITLDSTSENIFQWSGSAWEDQGTPTDNDTVMVNDDGDGDPSIYVYDLPQLTWIKIADASVITGDHNTLNGAYDEGGAGVGRTITVDAAPVKLDATSGSDAPLELTNLSSAPTTNLANGQLAVVGGILYAYDSTRTKWLSVQRETFAFGRRGSSKDQWINHYAGTLASNNSGLRVMRNATIVGLAGQLDGSGTCDMRIRKNDVLVDITTLSIAAATGAQDTTIDVDLSAGDFLQCYIENSTSVSDPMIVVEIAWRV